MLDLFFTMLGLFFYAIFFGAIALVVLTIIRISNLSGRPVEENVIQRWAGFIPGQSQSGEEFLSLAQQEFTKRGSPFGMERVSFGLAGQAGSAIRMVYSTVYSSYISYEAIGNDLSLHYVLYRKGNWFYAIPWIGPLVYRLLYAVYVHEHNKLIGFATMTIDCAKEAAGTLMDKFDIDRKRGIKESSGQLGPL